MKKFKISFSSWISFWFIVFIFSGIASYMTKNYPRSLVADILCYMHWITLVLFIVSLVIIILSYYMKVGWKWATWRLEDFDISFEMYYRKCSGSKFWFNWPFTGCFTAIFRKRKIKKFPFIVNLARKNKIIGFLYKVIVGLAWPLLGFMCLTGILAQIPVYCVLVGAFKNSTNRQD